MKKMLVITGGSRGIGLAAARQFLSAGYGVINLSRSQCPLEQVHHLETDFSQQGWEKTIGPRLTELLRGADEVALVHNAAFLGKGAVGQLQADDARTALDINVLAPIILNEIVLPYMASGSSILYLGSTLSEKAVANSAIYVTTKHAIAGLMRSTCQDLSGTGIHTVCVCPGFTDTEMLRQHIGNDSETLRSIAATNTQGRLVDPEEIADLLFYCAQSPVVNGSVIHANLGQVES